MFYEQSNFISFLLDLAFVVLQKKSAFDAIQDSD